MIGVRVGVPQLVMFLSPNCTQHCTAGGRGRNSSNLRICNPARSGKHKPLASHWGKRTQKILKAAALLLQSRLEGNGDKQGWLSPLAGYRVEPPSLPTPRGTRAGYPRPGDAEIHPRRCSGASNRGIPGGPAPWGYRGPPAQGPSSYPANCCRQRRQESTGWAMPVAP